MNRPRWDRVRLAGTWIPGRCRISDRLLLGLILGACLASGGCGELGLGKAKWPGANDPISETEAAEFAQALVAAVSTGGAEEVNRLIDWRRIAEKATRSPDTAELDVARTEFKNGLSKALTHSTGVFGQIHTAIEEGGSYKLLHVLLSEDPPYVLMRLKMPNGGLNYHQLFLARDKGGQVIADDLFVFLSEEKISETFRKTWVAFAHEKLESSAGKQAAATDPYFAYLDTVKKITDLTSQGQPAEALELYETLPESLRRDKGLLLMRLHAALEYSDDEYQRCIDDFRAYHPDDVALDCVLIDAYVLREEYAKALECIARTHTNIGGDPMLLVQRAVLLMMLDRHDEARQTVAKVIAAEPDLAEAYETGVNLSLAERNFDDTVKFLNALEKNFEYAWDDLKLTPGFAEFVKSPQFEAWEEARRPANRDVPRR